MTERVTPVVSPGTDTLASINDGHAQESVKPDSITTRPATQKPRTVDSTFIPALIPDRTQTELTLTETTKSEVPQEVTITDTSTTVEIESIVTPEYDPYVLYSASSTFAAADSIERQGEAEHLGDEERNRNLDKALRLYIAMARQRRDSGSVQEKQERIDAGYRVISLLIRKLEAAGITPLDLQIRNATNADKKLCQDVMAALSDTSLAARGYEYASLLYRAITDYYYAAFLPPGDIASRARRLLLAISNLEQRQHHRVSPYRNNQRYEQRLLQDALYYEAFAHLRLYQLGTTPSINPDAKDPTNNAVIDSTIDLEETLHIACEKADRALHATIEFTDTKRGHLEDLAGFCGTLPPASRTRRTQIDNSATVGRHGK